MNIRVGQGYDLHRLEEGKEFWLGGIQLDHTKGAVGHSDADVLIHAICDAILGAADLRDIGYHFSDTAPEYKGIDSKLLLKDVMKMLRAKGFELGNVDATVVLQQPKVNPHIDKIKSCLAEVMNVSIDQISIKATTNEKLGYLGREEGVACYSVALIYKS